MQFTKKEIIRNTILVILGTFFSSVGFVLFLEPANINCGGVSGVAMLVKHVANSPYVTMGSVVALINIPLFLVGFRKIGKYFCISSICKNCI